MKYCVDCKHYLNLELHVTPHLCLRKEGPVSMVTGKPEVITSDCESQRTTKCYDYCGPDAIYILNQRRVNE